MGYKLVLKDDKYYEDLIYLVIKALKQPNYHSLFLESRIKLRNAGESIKDELPTEGCSAFFNSELEDLLSDIFINAGILYTGLEDISKNPTLGDIAIKELDRRRLENHRLRCLTTILKEMNCLNVLHFGEPIDTGIYINKSKKGWESIIAEKSSPSAEIVIYRKFFKHCKDACNDIINLLADCTSKSKSEKICFADKVKSLRHISTIFYM